MFRPGLAELPAQQMSFAGALQVIVQHEDVIRICGHGRLFTRAVENVFRRVKISRERCRENKGFYISYQHDPLR